jgi:hypothetical protein
MGSLGVDALTTYGQKLIQTNQANDLDSYPSSPNALNITTMLRRLRI